MLFNCKVDVLRITKTKDSLGGYTETETTTYQNLPCRINWSRGSERIQFAKNTYYRDAKLYCRPIEVTVKDRVKYNGTTYEIANVCNMDNMSRYMLLEIRLVQ